MEIQDINDDMFTDEELDALYGTNFAIHKPHANPMETDNDVYDAEISCMEDKYDHDIERMMSYQN